MENPRKHFLTFHRLALLILVSFGLISCSEKSDGQNPPIVTRINLSSSGPIAEFDLEVVDHLIYNFAIRFTYPEGDQERRSEIRKVIGGHALDKAGNPVEPGILTPLILTIAKKDGPSDAVIYRKVVTPHLTSWGGNAFAEGTASFSKYIGHCDLPPGRYSILLEHLSGAKEYALIPTFFLVGMDKYKTTFDPKNVDRSKTCPQ